MTSSSQNKVRGGFLGTERFSIEARLGEGSMGAVYLAYDRERDIQVALKTLRRVDASGIYRFKREFRALADLQHPNLVVLHDLFADGSEWFFTMEYVQGRTFLEFVSESMDQGARGGTRNLGRDRDADVPSLYPSPVRDFDVLRRVLIQIASGITFVHDVGKLHRDLKPDNVLITPAGRAVVLDFGIALERDDAHGTLEAGVMGTPAYMSPEQAASEVVSGATDWYALGVMVYEALTGMVPFDGNFVDVLRDKRRLDPPSPSQVVSGVPKDLDRLCMALLRRDPSHRPTGPEIIQALSGNRSASERPPVLSDDKAPFVGREPQLRELERALRATDRGKPVVAFVHGSTGMGKTALAEQFIVRAQSETKLTVLKGRCYERELVPFKAFDSLIDSLSRYLRRVNTVHAADVMPRDIQALAQLFPVLKRVEMVGQMRRRSPPPSDPHVLRAAAFAALKSLLRRLSEQRPLILLIDDLQWGDVDSARLIAEIISGPDAPAMLLVCTYRAGDVEGSQCLRTLFGHTRENHAVDTRQITVGPLSDEDMRALCHQLLEEGEEHGQDGVDVAKLAREARGNPYLLTELITRWRNDEESDVSSGVLSLAEALAERLSGLPQEARDVLELVSVAGRPLPEPMVVSLVAPTTKLHAMLSMLHQHKLVRGVGTIDHRALEIYHEGIRRAVLEHLPAERIRHWHRRLADVMEQGSSPDLPALTEHLIGAEDYSRASIYAIRAAVQASRTLAFDKAAELYAIAVRHHEDSAWRNELMIQWAEALVNAGRGAEAAEVYLEAASQTTGSQAAGLQRKAGVQLMVSGHIQRGRATLRSIFKTLGLSLPEFERDAIAECAELHQQIQERGFAFVQRPMAEILSTDLERFDAIWEITQAFMLFDPLLVMPMALRNLQTALELGDVRRVVPALCSYHMQFETLVAARDGEAPRALKAAEALSHESGDARGRAWVAMARGAAYQMQGLFKPALLHLSQAEEIFRTRCQGAVQQVRMCRQMMGYLFTVLGQSRDFVLVEQWVQEADQRDDLMGTTHMRLLAVHGALAEDDRERAEVYAAATEHWNESAFGLTALLARLARSRLALYTEDLEASRLLSAQLSEPVPSYAVPAWRADGWLQRCRHKLLEARFSHEREAHLVEAEMAITQCEGTGVAYYADHLTLCRAGILHLRGDDAAAIAALDSVIEAGEQSGDGEIILACASMRKGQLAGGLQGENLIAEAKRTLSARGIRRPVSFARVYAPGFGDPTAELKVSL